MLAPSGRPFDDSIAEEFAGLDSLTLLSGRYEGIDERVREQLADDAVSIGPYVLSGGEPAAMVVADAVLRKLPGALGDERSAVEESFSEALEGGVEYPHYTRPASYRGWEVPDVLLSGHHEQVRSWRLEQARRRSSGPRRFEAGTCGRKACAAVAHGPAASANISAPIESPATPPPQAAFFSPMTELIETLERSQMRQVPDFRVGDRVRVHFQVVEGTRRRTQVFEGVVLKEKGGGPQRTFTVRKLSFGVGVERTFPVHSPKIERIEVVGRGEVRRAKLYYLRGRVGRKARLREMRDFRPEDVGDVGEATADGAAEEAAAEAPPEPTPRPPESRRGTRRPQRRGAAEAAEEPAAEEPAAEEDAAPPQASAEPEAERGRRGARLGRSADEEQAPAEGDKQGQSA